LMMTATRQVVPVRRTMSIRRILRQNLRPSAIFVNFSLIAICVVCVFPVLWTISASLKIGDEIYNVTPSLIPKHPSLENYIWMFTRSDMSLLPLNLWNSFKVTMGALIIQCVTATMAGYAFGRLKFRGRDLLFYLLVMLMFIPRAGGLMALYELMETFHLRNTHIGLILLYPAAISVALFVMRQNFLGVPRELEEAAVIDGAGTWRLLLDVDLPFVRGGIAVVAIWEFIYVWGEYLIALTLLDFPELETVAIAVTKLKGWSSHFTSRIVTPYGTESATFVVAMLPMILMFVLLQKWFVRGLSEGILKM
jgi:multiple sugar transport system permease protein